VFYRGAWCPYCNIALRTYQAALVPELARRGVPLLAISPQAPDGGCPERCGISVTAPLVFRQRCERMPSV
ncbi:MAG: hypothetical protein ACREQ5_14860, partial [Candidatus Dormibacteria bacterium]